MLSRSQGQLRIRYITITENVFVCFCIQYSLVAVVFMAALCNRADDYIFILWFVLLLFFFPHLISAAAHWTSAILSHMVWP